MIADIKQKSRRSLGTDFYLIDELLTEEERSIRDKVRAFLLGACGSSFELIPKIAALRIAGGSIRGYGCPGMSTIAAGLVLQELSRADASFCVVFGATSLLAMTSIAMLGSEEQKQRWLPPMARLEKQGAFGLTEPDHGSDAVGLETRAHHDGNTYVINGTKRWIGGASYADVTIIWARDDNGDVAGFLVAIANKQAGTAIVHITSSPSGGEIYIDGKFFGNAPSDIALAPGEHVVRVTLGGKEWTRTVQITTGEIHLHAELPGVTVER